MNNKKILKLIGFNFVSLIILLLINNIPYIKSLFFDYENASFIIINIPIIISYLIIFLSSLINIKSSKTNYKRIVFIMIMATNFLTNITTSFSAWPFLLIYLFILFITYITMIITKKSFCTSMPIGISLLLIIFFVFGILNILRYSILVLVALLILGLLIILKNKSYSKKIIDNFFDTSFIIFSVLFIIAILGGINQYVHIWDEYSHWAYDAKVTIDTKRLGLFSGLVASTSNYPPILSLWHYFISIFSTFNECHLYIGLTIFSVIYLFPCFTYLERKNKFLAILTALTMFIVPIIFNGSYSYNLLYADLPLAFVTLSILIICLLEKKDIKFQKWISLLFVIVTLIKPQGFVNACSILLLLFLIDCFNNKPKKVKDFLTMLIDFIKKWKWCIIATALSWLIWQLVISFALKTNNYYDYIIVPDSLKSTVSSKLNKSFITNFGSRLLKSLDEPTVYGFFNINLFAFSVLLFCFINKVNKKLKNNYNIFAFIITYIVFFMLMALSVFVMLSYYEAENLASFGRYLNVMNAVLLLYAIFALTKYISINKNLKYLYIAIVILVVYIPFSSYTYFISNYNTRVDSATHKENLERQFNVITSKTEKDSRIFVINQKDDDGIMVEWYVRYYTYPRFISASSGAINWKIKTENNKDDLRDWGFTVEKWFNHLKEYDFDYVYFYTVTDELEEMLVQYGINKKDLDDNTLFKIDFVNNKLLFVE